MSNTMVGNLAQIIALVSYGNAYLIEGHNLEGFYPSNSTFQFCNNVSFVDVKKFICVRESEIAENPNEWFSWLKSRGCQRLSIHYTASPKPDLPDHISVSFVGGGGHWYLCSHMNRWCDYWLGRWDVTDETAPDSRIWKVTYGRVARKRPLPSFHDSNLSEQKAELKGILTRIKRFAESQGLTHFADCFQSGIESLSTPLEVINHGDLLPSVGYRLDAGEWVLGMISDLVILWCTKNTAIYRRSHANALIFRSKRQ